MAIDAAAQTAVIGSSLSLLTRVLTIPAVKSSPGFTATQPLRRRIVRYLLSMDSPRADARLLRATAAVIERDGLAQGRFGTDTGPKCLLGAFGVALGRGTSGAGRWSIFFSRGEVIAEFGALCDRTGLAAMVPRPGFARAARSHRRLAMWMADWSDSVGDAWAVTSTLRRCAAILESRADAHTAEPALGAAFRTLLGATSARTAAGV